MTHSDPILERLAVDRRQAADVRVLVMTGYGLNCEAETAAAFARLGASPSPTVRPSAGRAPSLTRVWKPLQMPIARPPSSM